MKMVSRIFALSLALALNISADSVTDKLKQGWEKTKQTAKDVGAKIIDPVNIPKYKKLLAEAEAELNACTKAHNCIVPGNKYEDKVEYRKCQEEHCSKQLKKFSEIHKSVIKREVAVGVAAGLAGSTIIAAGMIGGTIALEDEEKKQAFRKKYNMNEDEFKLYFEFEHNINHPSNRVFNARNNYIKEQVQLYIKNTKRSDYTQDGYIRAIAGKIGKTPLEVLEIGEWKSL